ncbi:MAG: GNAT family protein [Bacteroidota bacterium]
MYDNVIRADSNIFSFKPIPVQENFLLRPISAKPEIFDAEIEFYKINSQSEEVRRFLPGAYADTVEEAKEKLVLLIQKGVFKGAVTYCICEKGYPAPLGYICLNSPLIPSGYNTWTIDFWSGETMRGKALMTVCVHTLLGYAQENAIEEVKAIVDPENQKAINVLERAGFVYLSQEAEGERRYIYGVRLN